MLRKNEWRKFRVYVEKVKNKVVDLCDVIQKGVRTLNSSHRKRFTVTSNHLSKGLSKDKCTVQLEMLT